MHPFRVSMMGAKGSSAHGTRVLDLIEMASNLVASLLLIAMPFVPSSFLLLVAMPGAPSSVLAPMMSYALKSDAKQTFEAI